MTPPTMAEATASTADIPGLSIPESGKVGFGLCESSFGEYNINHQVGTLLNIGGDDVFCPPARRLIVQPRHCGDFYAEIDGLKQRVSGYGPRAVDAIRMAVGKLS